MGKTHDIDGQCMSIDRWHGLKGRHGGVSRCDVIHGRFPVVFALGTEHAWW